MDDHLVTGTMPVVEDTMNDIFLSYARKGDESLVRKLYDALCGWGEIG